MPELLKSCPFCGGTDIGLADNTGPKLCTSPHAFAWCRNRACFASGNESDTVAEAITAWNTRASTTPVSSDGVVRSLALKLAAQHDDLSSSPTKAVTAINAGVDMCSSYWEALARAALSALPDTGRVREKD